MSAAHVTLYKATTMELTAKGSGISVAINLSLIANGKAVARSGVMTISHL
jgi:hypothetical protein